MAFSGLIDATKPLGTEKRRLADDYIRWTKVAFKERLAVEHSCDDDANDGRHLLSTKFHLAGTAAAIVAVDATFPGRLYWETDTGILKRDSGTEWVKIAASDHGRLDGLDDDDHTQYLLADGTRNLDGNLTVLGNGSIGGTLNVTGNTSTSNVSVGGTLGVTGAVTFSSTLTAGGNVGITGDLTASGELAATGLLLHGSDADIVADEGGLDIKAVGTIRLNYNYAGSMASSVVIYDGGAGGGMVASFGSAGTTFHKNVALTGDATITGDLAASGILEATDLLLHGSDADIVADEGGLGIKANGTILLNYNYAVSMASSVVIYDGGAGGGIVAAFGSAGTTFYKNVVLGDATTDTVTYTARAASHFIPSATDTYDLGDSSLKWRNLHLSGIASVAALTSSGNIVTTGGYLRTDTGNIYSTSGNIYTLTGDIKAGFPGGVSGAGYIITKYVTSDPTAGSPDDGALLLYYKESSASGYLYARLNGHWYGMVLVSA